MSHVITSLQNPRIKSAIKLRDRRGRGKQGRIIIDGSREILRAIGGGVELVELFVCREVCASDDAQELLAAAKDTSAEWIDVAPHVLEKLAFGQRTEGIVAVAQTPQRCLSELALTPRPLVVVLEGVEKPGNVGAVVRSADGAGVSAVIIADGHTDIYNPNAIRASLGSIFTMPICAASSDEAKAWLTGQALRIVTAIVGGQTLYTGVDFTAPTAIVLGSEAVGLSDIWRDDCVTPIRLPMCGVSDSLNVSATAAVLFYEALRQRSAS